MKQKKCVSMKTLKNCPDADVTLIHENPEELKDFLLQHASLPAAPEPEKEEDFFNPSDDLFRQTALAMDCSAPLEVKWCETYVLRKKRNTPAPIKKVG